ncbi:MAG: hypothetical protein ABUL60_13005 [Myxococcales bacterium]
MRTLVPVAVVGLLCGCTGILDGAHGDQGSSGDRPGGLTPPGSGSGSGGTSTSSSGGASASALVATPRIARLSRS